jgi:glycosyltransferase 2 family protein
VTREIRYNALSFGSRERTGPGQSERTVLKHHILGFLKIAVPLGIIGWLIWHVAKRHPEALQPFHSGEANLGMLLAAMTLVLLAHVVAMARWHLLLRGLLIPIRLRDSLRLGFLGHLMTFVSPGQVGGDVFKAVFIAREHASHRAAAIATILVDRLCGLYGLLIVTSIALMVSGAARLHGSIAILAKASYLCTGIGAVAIVLALTPAFADSRSARRVARLPYAGGLIARFLAALRLYRSQPGVLATVAALSLLVHALMACAVYMTARAIYADIPTLAEHFVISPVASVAGALPLTPGGLGSFELALAKLYNLFSAPDAQGRGVIVSLLVRLAMIACAAVGVAFYWLNHREMRQVLRQAEGSASVGG